MADLAHGLAYRRGTRLICAACDRAMGGGGEQAPANSGAGRKPHSGTHWGALSVALASVALAGWALWQVHASRMEWERLVQDRSGQVEAFDQRLERWETEQRADWATSLQDVRAQMQSQSAQGGVEREQALAALRAQWGDWEAASQERLQALQTELAAWEPRWAERQAELQGLRAEWAAIEADWKQAHEQLTAISEDLELRVRSLEGAYQATFEPKQGVEAAAWYPITDGLLNEKPSMRLEALYSLEQSHDVRICPFILPLLEDVDPMVRVACARVLAEHAFRPAVPKLIDGLEDPVLAVRSGFLESLRTITGRQFGFRPDGRETERKRPLQEWRDWWAQHGETFLAGQPG